MGYIPKVRRSLRALLICCLCFFISSTAFALTYYSQAGGNFTTGAIWSESEIGTGVVAAAGTHTYFIKSTHNVVMNANLTFINITVRNGGILSTTAVRTITGTLDVLSGGSVTVATRIVTIAGNWTNAGTISGSTGGLSFSTFTGVNDGSISFSGAGSFAKTTGSFTNGAAGTISVVGLGTITLGTGDFVNNNTSASVNFGSSLVPLAGSAVQSIGGFTTTGLFSTAKTGGTVTTLTGNITTGGITINGTGGIMNMGTGLTHTTTGVVTLTAGTLNGGSSILNVNVVSTSAWNGTGTVFTAGTSTVNFGAAGLQTLSASATSFYNLTFSNT